MDKMLDIVCRKLWCPDPSSQYEWHHLGGFVTANRKMVKQLVSVEYTRITESL